MPISLNRLPALRLIALLCALGGVAFTAGPALADSMSLSIAPAPVEELTSQITWSASSEEGTFAIVAVNNPGVQCAATPQGDAGHVVTPTNPARWACP
jgi:hypothetical protein